MKNVICLRVLCCSVGHRQALVVVVMWKRTQQKRGYRTRQRREDTAKRLRMREERGAKVLFVFFFSRSTFLCVHGVPFGPANGLVGWLAGLWFGDDKEPAACKENTEAFKDTVVLLLKIQR